MSQNHSDVFLFFFPADKVLDSCSFRDEDDDCTYHYTVENPKDKDLEVQVLKKKGEQHILNFHHWLQFIYILTMDFSYVIWL